MATNNLQRLAKNRLRSRNNPPGGDRPPQSERATNRGGQSSWYAGSNTPDRGPHGHQGPPLYNRPRNSPRRATNRITTPQGRVYTGTRDTAPDINIKRSTKSRPRRRY